MGLGEIWAMLPTVVQNGVIIGGAIVVLAGCAALSDDDPVSIVRDLTMARFLGGNVR